MKYDNKLILKKFNTCHKSYDSYLNKTKYVFWKIARIINLVYNITKLELEFHDKIEDTEKKKK